MAGLKVASVGVLIMLTGCLGGGAKAEDPGTSGPARIGDERRVQTESTPRAFLFDVHESTISNSLVRYQLTADEALTATAKLSVRSSQWGIHEGCLAAAVTAPAGETPGGTAVLVFQGLTDMDRPRARAGGASFDENIIGGPLQDYAGELIGADTEVTVPLEAGQSLLIEVGGSGQGMLSEEAVSTVDVTVSGRATLARLEDSALWCGVTWFPANEATIVTDFFRAGSVAAGAKVALSTTSASTAYLSYDQFNTAHALGDLRFLGETVAVDRDPEPFSAVDERLFHRFASEGGEIGFDIEAWVNTFTGYSAWFLADAHWSNVTVATPMTS